MMLLVTLTALLQTVDLPEAADPPPAGLQVRGMTISCQTWGQEWGTSGFARELDELQALGINWVAIHPYAWIRADGTGRFRPWDPEQVPEWLRLPIEAAHERGMRILIKPHLGYWGSPFRWRGAIEFPDPEQRQRFFRTYREWMEALAPATADADAFAVATELEQLYPFEQEWREVIARVRSLTPAHLTVASNWSDYETVPFWDALDTIGVQAYFPLVDHEDPDADQLRASWKKILAGLRSLSQTTGKPVVFTELGYDRWQGAAREPWRSGRPLRTTSLRGDQVQQLCFRLALEVLEKEKTWLRGAFLWKWFVGEAPGEDFLLDRPPLRHLLRDRWGAADRTRVEPRKSG
jgi:hypothetical protein